MAVIDQIKRFERWQRNLPTNTAYLVGLVLEEIVPLLQARGFGRFHDYAGGSTSAVGPNCIPLQRRSGAEWPTIEILFHKRRAPSLAVHFGALPEICRRRNSTEHKWIDIPRINASVVEGPAFFSLCKGTGKSFDCNFGYRWYSIKPKQKIRKEIDALKLLLPWLLDVFDRGIPREWYEKSDLVDRHALITRLPGPG